MTVERLFVNGAHDYTLPKSLYAPLKKLAAASKYSATLVNCVLLCYIKISKERAAEAEQAGLHELAEAVFNASVAQNVLREHTPITPSLSSSNSARP